MTNKEELQRVSNEIDDLTRGAAIAQSNHEITRDLAKQVQQLVKRTCKMTKDVEEIGQWNESEKKYNPARCRDLNEFHRRKATTSPQSSSSVEHTIEFYQRS